MPRNSFLKIDLKKLNDLKSQLPRGASEALDKFQTQLSNYEGKALELVKKLESQQKEVRRFGKQRIGKFTAELQKTRSTVEKKVLGIVGEKRKDIQTRVNELVIYLTGLAGKDVLKSKKKSAPKAKSGKKTTTSRKTKAKRVIQLKNQHQNINRGAESLSQA